MGIIDKYILARFVLVNAKSKIQRFFMPITSDIQNPAVCRTRHAYADFWECLVDYDDFAYKCPYIFGMDSRHFCMHHDYRAFAIHKRLEGVSSDEV
jgi:hypothetical protein